MAIAQKPMIWQDRLQDMLNKARQDLRSGAMTEAYQANRQEVVQLLTRAQAGEWTAFLQYWHHYFMSSDIHSAEIREFFKKQAMGELEHARRVGERIQLLGGVPCDAPREIADVSPLQVSYGQNLRSMLEEDLIGERATIAFYAGIVRYCGDKDIVTRVMFEEFLADEEEDADEICTLLYAISPNSNQPIPDLHGGR